MMDIVRVADTFPWSVGVLGVDGTGPTLVRRLLDLRPTSTRIVAWGLNRVATADLVGDDGERASSPADLAARSAVVLVESPGPDHLSELLTGPLGFQAGVHSPTRLVVTGGTGPTDGVRELALRVQYQTAGLLRLVYAAFPDTDPAEVGDIAVYCSAEDFRLVAPVARLFGHPVRVGALSVLRDDDRRLGGA